MLLTPAVQKYDGCTKVILIGAQRLSCGSQRLSCGAQGYPAVHNGYPGQTWVGARDTCVSKKERNFYSASIVFFMYHIFLDTQVSLAPTQVRPG